MARKPRIHYEGALYHVIVRGNNKEHIFKHDHDKEEYLKKIAKYIERYRARLYAYVIMDNHCHLLIEVADMPLSKIMQLIQQTYTAWYNRRYKHTGHVFEQRYKSILCDKDEYLLQLVRYIHRNPVRAKIGELDYWFSSHNDYLKLDDSTCDVYEALSIFSSDKSSALRQYRAFMNEIEDSIHEKKEVDLGPDFEEVLHRINEVEFIKLSFEALVYKFELDHNILIDELKGRYIKHDLIGLRKQFIIEVLEYKSISQKELGELFDITANQVSRIYNSRIKAHNHA